jgi:hypothetical protein
MLLTNCIIGFQIQSGTDNWRRSEVSQYCKRTTYQRPRAQILGFPGKPTYKTNKNTTIHRGLDLTWCQAPGRFKRYRPGKPGGFRISVVMEKVDFPSTVSIPSMINTSLWQAVKLAMVHELWAAARPATSIAAEFSKQVQIQRAIDPTLAAEYHSWMIMNSCRVRPRGV